MSLEDIIINSKEKANMPIFNNAAQVFNHTFFFECMKKNGGGEVPEEISKHFGGKENFIKTFKEAGMTQFGSGWAWLLQDKFGNLKIVKMPNAETPVMYGEKPLLTVDVWEHAYYLDYQNKRADFIDTFLNNLVNWEFVLKNLK
ncbi:MAG: Superoxide dismutase (Fe) [Alphaproteobacteria bacterium ADurb.Bin438]|nr:MAG: Superoxide dismutase (Fe) [Alphaproteobacteria bacterium ADurb.Bin438]